MFLWFESSLLVHLKEGNQTRKCCQKSEKYFSLKHNVSVMYTLFGLLFFPNKNMLNGNLLHWILLCFIYICFLLRWWGLARKSLKKKKNSCCLRWKKSFSLCAMKPELKICSYFQTPEVCLNSFFSCQMLTICHMLLVSYADTQGLIKRVIRAEQQCLLSVACWTNTCTSKTSWNLYLYYVLLRGIEFISAGRLMFTDTLIFLYLLIYCSWIHNE